MNNLEIKTEELLNIGFGGAFSTDTGYTNATGETMDGTISRRTGGEELDFQRGVILNGNQDGIEFDPRVPFGNKTLDKPFWIETTFKPESDQRALSTVLSIGGSLYVRYTSTTTMEYGFDVEHNGSWITNKQSVVAPEVEKSHTLRLLYEPTNNGAKLRVFLNGAELASAISEIGKPNLDNNKIGFGNDIHTTALDRGFHGSISKVVITRIEEPYDSLVLKNDGSLLLGQADKINEEQVDEVNQNLDVSNLEPSFRIPIYPNETTESIAAKASLVRPLPKQVKWQQYEQTAFIHYGINTYYGVEWGNFNEDPNMFQPTELDTDQWARTLRDSGFKLAILTVKHHDGFVLYPTRYTDFSVASSSWRDGKGNVLREFVDSMRKYGLKIGVYLSPADHGAYTDGIFANGSPRIERTIPTLVEGDDRAGNPNLPTFTLPATDYGEMLLNQLYEVLTEYGPIDEVWFDGAQGHIPGDKKEHYDWDSYYTLINALQPEAVIAITGHDVRWVGNESGWAREDEWSVLAANIAEDGSQFYFPEFRSPDLGSRETLVSAAKNGMKYLTWWPAEVDVSIRQGWFYHDHQQPKSLEELRNIYYQSVARNSVLLLNIPPDKRGKFADVDVERLIEWHQSIQNDFAIDHAKNASISAENGTTDPSVLIDGVYENSWQSASSDPSTITFSFEQPVTVDKVVLQENIYHGQQVESFAIDYQTANGDWEEIVSGGAIGYKRIAPFSHEVTAKEYRVRIIQARGIVHLSEIGLYQGRDE